MLGHFQDVDLTPLLVDLNGFHVFLMDCLDGNFLARFGVLSQFHETKLSLTKIVFEFVIIKQIRATHDLSQTIQPILLRFPLFEVQYARLVRWEHNLYRVKVAALRLTLLRCLLLNECADQRMHDSVLLIALLPITVKLITSQDRPMLLVPIGLRLQIALTFKHFLLLVLVIAKSLQRLFFFLLLDNCVLFGILILIHHGLAKDVLGVQVEARFRLIGCANVEANSVAFLCVNWRKALHILGLFIFFISQGLRVLLLLVEAEFVPRHKLMWTLRAIIVWIIW